MSCVETVVVRGAAAMSALNVITSFRALLAD